MNACRSPSSGDTRLLGMVVMPPMCRALLTENQHGGIRQVACAQQVVCTCRMDCCVWLPSRAARQLAQTCRQLTTVSLPDLHPVETPGLTLR